MLTTLIFIAKVGLTFRTKVEMTAEIHGIQIGGGHFISADFAGH